MKKTLLMASAVSALMFGACSHTDKPQTDSSNTETVVQEFTSLKDSYNRLVKLPNISETNISNIKFGQYEIKVEKNAVANNLSKQQISQAGDSLYSILDDIPMKHIVNGATNNIDAGFVYANTLETGENEVLIVSYGIGAGYIGVTYGTADDATLSAVQRAPLAMEGYLLNITLDNTSGQQVNLINFYDN